MYSTLAELRQMSENSNGEWIEWCSVITLADGRSEWRRHRSLKTERIGKPTIEFDDGGKEWRKDGRLHRIEGPAVEKASSIQWWINGDRHRRNGPAYEGENKYYYWRGDPVTVSLAAEYIAATECAFTSHNLPAYVLLWIVQWAWPEMQAIEEEKIIGLLQSRINIRRNRSAIF